MRNKTFKAGILITLLVVPALVFLFLKTFGENEFKLPYYFPELDERGHAVVESGDTLFRQIEDFELVSQDKAFLRLSDLRGDIKLVSFFFSRCGIVCPILNSNLARVQETFKNESSIKLLSITVDSDFDTPEVLKAYAEEIGPGLKNWYFLSGDKAYIYDLAIKGFKLPVSDASVYTDIELDVDELFIHSEKVLLLDGDDFIRGIYDGTDLEEMERIRLEVKVLRDIMKKG
jgi:protein SCO1/2